MENLDTRPYLFLVNCQNLITRESDDLLRYPNSEAYPSLETVRSLVDVV